MNRVIFAPAGGRKTQSIIDLCQKGVADKSRLIVTFTTTGQNVIEQRLWNCNKIKIRPAGIHGKMNGRWFYDFSSFPSMRYS